MITHYLTTTLRYFGHHRFFVAINLLGLAVGLCVCLLAGLYVQFELSYDAYHTQSDRIYRLVTDITTDDNVSRESASAPMASAFRAAFPEVEESTRIFLDYLIIQPEDRSFFREETVAYADPSVFSIFNFPLITGDTHTALSAPFSVVLSETAAHRFFGTTDCQGEMLLISDSDVATVTAVMRDMPRNSHFRTDMLVSMSTLLEAWNPAMNEQWSRFGFYTYVLLPSASDGSQLGQQFAPYVQPNLSPDAQYSFALEPLTDVYLKSEPRGTRAGSSQHGSQQNVYIFSVVAALVLFIACFNFINLTTALSWQRVKEVGVRRTLGATRRQLFAQALCDAALLSTVAFVMALLLSAGLLPVLNHLAGKTIAVSLLHHLPELFGLLALALAVGVLSGVYPALLLIRSSRQQPKSVARHTVQQGLMAAQFVVTTLLMATTAVTFLQLNYLQRAVLGFSQAHKVVVDFHFNDQVTRRSETIKQSLASVPAVRSVSFSSSVPSKAHRRYPTRLQNSQGEWQSSVMAAYFVDYDFLDQYDIKLLAGRGFSRDRATDSTEAMLINETAAQQLGFEDAERAVGQRFEQKGKQGIVIGVVQDFHTQSLREAIQPLTLRISPGWNLYTFATIAVASHDLSETLEKLEDQWQSLVPNQAFTYFFLDENYEQQYVADMRFGQLFLSLSVLSIVLACLGLVALSTLDTAQRTKEIGVRKVLGASVLSVARLLTCDFLGVVSVATFVGLLLAWWATDWWLQTFAYRVHVPSILFIGVGLAALALAALAVGIQATRAARANPAYSLRSE